MKGLACKVGSRFFSWVGPVAAVPAPDTEWKPWHDLMLHHPGRFKGRVKRAIRLQGCRHVVIAALDGLHRGLQILPNAPTPPSPPKKKKKLRTPTVHVLLIQLGMI